MLACGAACGRVALAGAAAGTQLPYLVASECPMLLCHILAREDWCTSLDSLRRRSYRPHTPNQSAGSSRTFCRLRGRVSRDTESAATKDQRAPMPRTRARRLCLLVGLLDSAGSIGGSVVSHRGLPWLVLACL